MLLPAALLPVLKQADRVLGQQQPQPPEEPQGTGEPAAQPTAVGGGEAVFGLGVRPLVPEGRFTPCTCS